ncbi:sensor histidine kinase [Lentzea sp. BCCO 10_0856]|uniref:histidine kinase n=1 Tax=Lentzea miocenica TaxID=3095431 RepID=A0ABU4SSC9_9PSEU|nr:sensor histidine kinase [Lentzea sp. BCCO 10_0856]MDX8028805.1 sensor histidine kinase [Lentzea sp. BCCO 10_0856]
MISARLAARPLLADSLLAAVVLLFQLGLAHGLYRYPLTWWALVEVSTAGALVLRRRNPIPVMVFVLAVCGLTSLSGHNANTVIVSVLVGVYSASIALRARWAIVLVVAVLAVGTLMPPPPLELLVYPDYTRAIIDWWTMVVITASLGQATRHSRRRALRLEHALGLLDDAHRRLAEDAVAVERNRIAREMHDIVAHGLSLIAVRAGVARMLPADSAQVSEAIGVIDKTSRESLAEMRTVLGVLRSSEQDGGGPQPGLDHIPALVERARESGLDLDVVCEGDPPDLSPGQALVAYRIVQEALTNVLKHAGQVRTAVRLHCEPGRVVIDVFNEAPDSVPDSVRSGHGLVGMRERVGMYGGVVHAGPADGGFRVTAELPVEAR